MQIQWKQVQITTEQIFLFDLKIRGFLWTSSFALWLISDAVLIIQQALGCGWNIDIYSSLNNMHLNLLFALIREQCHVFDDTEVSQTFCRLPNRILTYLLLAPVQGSVHVWQRVRAQDGAHRRGPLHGHEPVLPQQNLPDVVRSADAHRGVPEEMCAVDVTVLLPLHPQELSPLHTHTHTHTHQDH